jgi:hypothetical protein
VRRTILALGLLFATWWPAQSASAIETSSFGLGPAGPSSRTALHEDVRPGHHTDDAVRVWNKTDKPVVVNLAVQGATIDKAGQVSLGGNAGAARWVRLSTAKVTLAPHASVEVPVAFEGPRTMPSGTSTAAIVAEAESGPGGSSSVAVLQRVALMVYAKAPTGSPLRAALGWAAWVAVALLVGVVGYVAFMRRPRRQAVQSLRHVGALARVPHPS